MPDKRKYSVGDWVSFTRNNRVVYGKIEYAPKREPWQRDFEYVTTAGRISEPYIHESRKQENDNAE